MSPRDRFPIRVAADYDEMSRWAAELLTSELRVTPDLLFCAATGASPLGMYGYLADECSRDPHLFGEIRVLQLDEWGGLPRDTTGTCGKFLREHLLEPLRISEERYLGFDSTPTNPSAECRRLSAWLERHGPIDFCLVGLGLNGHVALNEPGESLHLFAHVAQLASETLRHPMLAETVTLPTYGLTLGMREILASQKIVLLVSGAHKQFALDRLRHAAITTSFPASLLSLHRNLVCLCDRAAAGPK